MTAVRAEVMGYIDEMPDAKLETLRPLLRLLTADAPLAIEADLTETEKAKIADGIAQYRADPESCVPLESLL